MGAIAGMMLLGCATAQAQPAAARPRACAVLKGRFTAAEATRLNPPSQIDSGRIQHALSLCNPGEVVVLENDQERNAFLSAPLILPRGVTLFVDEFVTLYASANPRDYDLRPLSCGVARASRVPSCKPFLFAYEAAYSGVMGGGVIDGQGGTPLAGSNRSWWDLAGQGREVPDLVSSCESQGYRALGVTLLNAAGYHLSLFKTIASTIAGLKIDSPANSASPGGLLLSNSPQADIANTWIRVPSLAISIQASILGPTSHVAMRDVHIFGGEGISIGDDTYGAVNDIGVSGLAINDARTGLTFDFRGSRLGEVEDIEYDDACLSNVATPVRAEEADGTFASSVPSGRRIMLSGVGISAEEQVMPLIVLAVIFPKRRNRFSSSI
jgi:polygalacturonase